MAFLIASVATASHSEPNIETSRGALLYSTHCIACHTANVHWRDKRIVTDWESLNNQVRRWQEYIDLGWSENDVAEVSYYLNAVYYHLPSANAKEIALKK
jgi:mono/diheme cytochrome c family protein